MLRRPSRKWMPIPGRNSRTWHVRLPANRGITIFRTLALAARFPLHRDGAGWTARGPQPYDEGDGLLAQATRSRPRSGLAFVNTKRGLDRRDQVAVLAFDHGCSEVTSFGTPAQEVWQRVHAISAGSGTVIGVGLRHGLDLLSRHVPEDARRLVILSDGNTNFGVHPRQLLPRCMKEQVIVDTVGIGSPTSQDYRRGGHSRDIRTVTGHRGQSGIRTVMPDIDPSEQELLERINAYRMRRGRLPWRFSSLLAQAARAHSVAMSREGFFAHVDPHGHGPAERVVAEGYGPFLAVEENIAMGTHTPTETLKAWIAGPGHYALLLDQTLTDAGIGFTVRWPVSYWTLDCARRRTLDPG